MELCLLGYRVMGALIPLASYRNHTSQYVEATLRVVFGEVSSQEREVPSRLCQGNKTLHNEM